MNPNDPAFPVEYKDFQPGSGNQVVRELVPGLTKREWVATNILTSFARIAMEKIHAQEMPEALSDQMDETMIIASLVLTDKLIAQLRKTEAKE